MHVWRVSLEQTPEVYEALWQTLSSDERARAERFRFEKDRTRFVVARGALRSILSRYVGLHPARLSFAYGAQGKPELAGLTTHSTLRFNLSHAGAAALCAVTEGREIGVDVEFIREDFASMEIAERFFSPREVAALQELPQQARTRAFFNCWTRKEAYIKALGEGLSCPLDSFAVSLAEEDAATLLWSAAGAGEVERWTMKSLAVGADYAAAVAVEGKAEPFRLWLWQS